ncbi:MAG: DEAD/DEAH box helicase family protein [Methylobacter sp.]|nr:DEAD/DEAH box helicase family protein [Methylobacter sp.]MDP2427936.1 DEAD/DEAH box helicase family protein [Methylobacter sp.]MDP3054070.1 DEAD/DEAH box helicase family protein [Methylobacter sp.]MDP3363614.1 DEAD/DEAH box helicase family protein [Methylobacter sp.]MDZ4220111.1 DEAD/DEAH box helicase family protein [Methylobacter sp.]
MNEAETRAELIDPKLTACGWGVVEGSKVLREFHITAGKIQTGGTRAKPMIADYVLVYKNRKIGIIEAKSNELDVAEGVAQAKTYAEKLRINYTYSSNGKEIYQIAMNAGNEGLVAAFPSPEALWQLTFSEQNDWKDRFDAVPFESVGGSKGLRYYQEIAVANTLNAIAEDKQRILLTMATGTGKTFVAFQIAWKLFQTRWNLKRDGSRRPRILFLADRNILANQAFNSFSMFPDDALVRITPKEISKKGGVPTNGSLFFTIFQTFMSGNEGAAYFGDYPTDYFDFVIIDECHRGGANDEGNWRGILDYFAPAVQLGLTATPKRGENVNTYQYFGDPVYTYSLKEGINDGFLTPFKVKRIQTTLDDYIFTSDDTIIEGEVEAGKIYQEADFNRIIVIKEREAKRVQIFMDLINQQEKTLVFCATQDHAAAVRDLINQYSRSKEPTYCVRVTANDGEIGEQYLREFQDNEKFIPTILTTSQKLSTGVDARNVRNIVLMRPVNSMIEFKQIVGRGTRLFDGKEYFTIYDFVDAYHHFADPEWDGEPIEPEVCAKCGQESCVCEKKLAQPCPECGERPCKCIKEPAPDCYVCGESPCVCNKTLKIKLGDSKERHIQHMISTSFWGADGQPISAEQFVKNLYGALPSYFQSEEELRQIWSKPMTRKALLDKLADAGYGQAELTELQKLIDAENSDLFDVLEYIAFNIQPMTREIRVMQTKPKIMDGLSLAHKGFVEFVLFKYVDTGVDELDQSRLPNLMELKYHSLTDAAEALGDVEDVINLFVNFQQHLYRRVA